MLTNAKKSDTIIKDWKKVAVKLAQVLIEFNDNEDMLIAEKDVEFAKQILKEAKIK